ncbi:hypothetical protein PanWU01x14_290850 [Parasponia andersonii]|uniref:Uncharacterized protein n=1 Tax=Parasponia andersonii TaxID=3476 RepID=A0A2P5AXL3_PARAD|nr:hypothetical protein PanWU01x14_290850 [Parasponia andersonii]
MFIPDTDKVSNSNAHMNRDPRCITKLKRKRISTSGDATYLPLSSPTTTTSHAKLKLQICLIAACENSSSVMRRKSKYSLGSWYVRSDRVSRVPINEDPHFTANAAERRIMVIRHPHKLDLGS